MLDVGAQPDVIACADWSSRREKRWIAVARATASGRYLVGEPLPVRHPGTLVERLGAERLLLGLDLPIGVPAAWARRAGIDDFKALLPELGRGRFEDFFEPAETPEEICLERPFYPARPGGARLVDLVERLGLEHPRDMLRLCDLAHTDRTAAAALFWTLGPNQVGKAAISGWRDLLQPALKVDAVALWPFDGELGDLLRDRPVTVVEIYPAELQSRLGVRLGRAGGGSKLRAEDRAGAAPALLDAAPLLELELTPDLRRVVEEGFEGSDGEDRFDALVGLMGMLLALRGGAPAAAPDLPEVRVEGWILGRPVDPAERPAGR